MKSSIWYEKYKPNYVKDLCLPAELKNKLQDYVDRGDIPSLGLFSSEPGTGKSATSHAIIKELGCEAIWINASLESGIDTLRGRIRQFASSSSFDDGLKVVVMDESDHISSSAQAAFRGFLDEFSANCRFIFTGNYPDKIIEPLLDRLEVYDFNQFPKQEMIKPIFEKLNFILNSEGIQFEPKDVAAIIGNAYPSIRSMISNLQKFSTSGTLVFTESDLENNSSFDIVMNSGSYMDMVQNVNSLSSPGSMFTFLYNNLDKYFNSDNYQNVVITLAKYQEMNSTVRDKHLNLSACLTEIWKYRVS